MFRYGRTARTTRGVRAVQAQRGGDPGEISAAYANLHEARAPLDHRRTDQRRRLRRPFPENQRIPW